MRTLPQSSPTDETPLVALRNLRVGMPAPDGGAPVIVLDGVDLTIAKGEIVGLVGESGSGKSMMALSMIGLVPPPVRVLSGSIKLEGRELIGLPERQWRSTRGGTVGMVFQDPMTGLNPVRSVGALLTESVRRHQRVDNRRALEIAEKALLAVGVPAARERLSAYPHQLSGGLRQRVMIALALVNDPKVIIADEPTTALDATIQAQILDLLRDRLHAAGGLMITHDLGVAADICDRIAVIYHGRIVEEGPTADVLRRPRHPYTAGLLAAVPHFGSRGSRLEPIPGQPPGPTRERAACSFQPRCKHARQACALAPALVASGPERRVACHNPIEEAAR
ncbi:MULTISPECIES: ABC transporter ATP-binding protein [unclassified Roseitalea]|uniref:ABC transporter ATP-binding protein n=1 Tax=unclassified Roseitalea TaxID=2639107 RepID=UPI00273E84F4|nr:MULTISPECIES: ABC transporter ATP-binding protein [unclassified Roseitalea]